MIRQTIKAVRAVVLALMLVPAVAMLSGPAAADGPIVIVIKDHQFHPAEIHVPAGKRVQLVIDNQDPTPEEFESFDLRREKLVQGHSKGSLWIGPLPAGEYSFAGEFHEKTAKGKLIAR